MEENQNIEREFNIDEDLAELDKDEGTPISEETSRLFDLEIEAEQKEKETQARQAEAYRMKAIENKEESTEEEIKALEREIDELDEINEPSKSNSEYKKDEEAKYREANNKVIEEGTKTPQIDTAPRTYIIQDLKPKPKYTWTKYQDFFPCASIEYMKEIYKKKSFAGKVFEIVMVEAAKTMAFNIQGQTKHKHEYSTNNIWISLEKIYQRTYRNSTKRIVAAMEIIAMVLDGKLKYAFTTEGSKNKAYLVLEIGSGVLTNTFKDFVQVFPEDYELTNAELVFLRQVQCGLFRNNEQTFRVETLLQFGKIAWNHDRCKKEQQEKTFHFIDRLSKEDHFQFKKIAGTGKYFVKDLKAKERKKQCW